MRRSRPVAELATDAEVEQIMATGERAIDALVRVFLRLRARDRAEGLPSDEPALGGVGMAMDELGRDELMLIASLAVRRLAEYEKEQSSG
jgi:hypothetical protein